MNYVKLCDLLTYIILYTVMVVETKRSYLVLAVWLGTWSSMGTCPEPSGRCSTDSALVVIHEGYQLIERRSYLCLTGFLILK